MIDSIEHVNRPLDFIKAAANFLAPGGVFFLDTSPLYCAKTGHYFFHYFPNETMPWVHLRHDFVDILKRAYPGGSGGTIGSGVTGIGDDRT
jgi:2-polyprenyl-3-methyl-5-hydroxy-6-metoxy-1,4-benzoquinol methylase